MNLLRLKEEGEIKLIRMKVIRKKNCNDSNH